MRALISSFPMIPFNEIVQGSVHHRGEAAHCIIGAKFRSQILALLSWESFNRKHGQAREQFSANSAIALKAVVKSTGVNESLHYLPIPTNSESQTEKGPDFQLKLFSFNCPQNRPVSAEKEASLSSKRSNVWKADSASFCSPVCQWPWKSHFIFISVFTFEKIIFSYIIRIVTLQCLSGLRKRECN